MLVNGPVAGSTASRAASPGASISLGRTGTTSTSGGDTDLLSTSNPLATASISHGRLSTPARTRPFNIAFIFLADLLTITIAAIAAMLIRTDAVAGFFPDDARTTHLLRPVALTIVPAWLLLIALFSGYQRKQLGAGTVEYHRVLNASLLTAGVLGISAYLLQYPMSRAFYFLMFAIGVPLVLLERYLMRRYLHRARRQGRFSRRVLIAGDCTHISDLVTVLNREPWLGYDIAGLLTTDAQACTKKVSIPTIGTPEQAVTAVREAQADIVIFTEGAYSRGRDFNRLARRLEGEKAELIVVPTLTDVSSTRMSVRPVAGIPLVHIDKPQAERAGTWLKRSFDIVGSLILIIAASPIVAVAALAIKLEDGGPVLFRQLRVGMGGRAFECLKLRSMVPDAEVIRAQQLADANEADGVLFKIKHDPRVTRVGHFLRRYSIDELPQFFNVLRGDMSLVGPRPALSKEVAAYKSLVRRRLDVRPGVTGLWQVSGRSDLSWDDAVRLDLYYVDNWSMIQDMTILMRTFKAIFSSSGAY